MSPPDNEQDAGSIGRACALIKAARNIGRDAVSWEIGRSTVDRWMASKEPAADAYAAIILRTGEGTFLGHPYAVVESECEIELLLDGGDRLTLGPQPGSIQISLA